ncbi:MAG: helicase-related protein [Vicinamibacterales bacterium]
MQLKGRGGGLLPGVADVYQVDANRVRLKPNRGAWRCRSCRRRFARRTPRQACPAWRCGGTLEFLREDPDSYDLQLLDQGYSMLRPEEHTAMVPHAERERLENLFKGESDVINTFVCTPTLELGVDIGQLDAVLMRNVPPLPANYWQRAGRAGRRHRMAVDVTYCRPVPHDRACFADPLKLLSGRVDPPAFNLRNEVMVGKHVHAAVITRLHQLTLDERVAADERARIDHALHLCLPGQVSSYLFEGGALRARPLDLAPLKEVISAHADELARCAEGIFQQGWPEADRPVTTSDALRSHVLGMVDRLDDVLERLNRRLRWAMGQIRRLNEVRERQGTLEPEDESLFRRCDSLVKRLKGTAGVRDGRLKATTTRTPTASWPPKVFCRATVWRSARCWQRRRSRSGGPAPWSSRSRGHQAWRSASVPGNLIYANGHRFVARRFHRDGAEERAETPLFDVSPERQAVKETNIGAPTASLGGAVIPSMAVCDVTLVHQSHISDDEEVRFQLGVAVYGMERDQHNGGRAYQWGSQALHHRRGVRLRLVNVGATSAIARFQRFGYPICTVCGQSVSPLSSDKQRDQFDESHTERCGKAPESVGLYADVVADVLSLPACADQRTAYSVLEALRFAAAQVLDMHMDDLQALVIGHVDRDEVDALLWDPMPGGSGLLDQICGRFEEIVTVARELVENCPSACDTSCIDCLQTFRNGYYHKHLDRLVAAERLADWGPRLVESHEIPARQPAAPEGAAGPANEAERRLRHLLRAAGFDEGIRGERIVLDPAIGSTTPDVIYRAAHHDSDEGICIYLDGLSHGLHGNPATTEKDRQIRGWLRNNGYEVLEMAVSDLSDPRAMTKHFRKLAGYLRDDERRDALRQDNSWFARGDHETGAGSKPVLRLVHPKPEDRYVSCVPLVPLRAAAGAFSDPQQVDEIGNWQGDWVHVDTSRRLRPGMFVAQVVGRSMEPAVPDGAYCLFASPVEGSRQGRSVLVRLPDSSDPESGERFTVKVYESEKAASEDGTWRHVKVVLKPRNPEFKPIELTVDEEGAVAVVAELVEVLG